MSTARTTTIGMIGARGHTGAEMLRLLDAHPHFTLVYAGSRSLAQEPVAQHIAGVRTSLCFETPSPDAIATHNADAWLLALPNRVSGPYIEAIETHSPQSVVVDLSADHRFDDHWVYGQPERNRRALRQARRIANPGCYATGLQLALEPVLPYMRDTPHAFGVSGYSGAGTTPSLRNDPDHLRDNLLPYTLTHHTHEQEVSRHLGHAVFFSPHVAPFFRGISLTVSIPVQGIESLAELIDLYRQRFGDEPLVTVAEQAPLVRDAAGKHEVHLGGFSLDPQGRRAVVIATLDNLLKGAATQALQNLNLACGFEELAGIAPWLT